MTLFNFPDQRIPESEKNLEWHVKHVENFLMYSGTAQFTLKKREMAELYLAAAGVLSPEQNKIICATITEKYGENFGPQYYVYPLIENMMESVISEYRTRPLKKRLMVNNENAVIKKLDKKVSMLSESLMRGINKEMESELGFAPETEQPEMQIPDDLQEFFQKDFRTDSEEIGEDVLYQLMVVKKEKERIYDALRHFLTVGRVWGCLDEKDGHPTGFIPHVMDTFTDTDVSETLQRNPQFFIYHKPLTINEIFNKFNLTKEQKDLVTNYGAIMNRGLNANYSYWFQRTENEFRINVVSMEWVSRKTSKFLVITKDGKEEYKILPDDYKPRKDREENIQNIEIDDVRHIIMCGPAVVLSWGSTDTNKQMQTIGNPKKRYLNAVGVVDDSRNGTNQIRSLAKKLLYLQGFASEVLYEIRINMRYIDGGVLVYDLANIPKEFQKYGEKALDRVHFYMKRDRIQYINSKDRKQNTYANSVNLSQKGRMTELINLLAMIESLAEKISGIPKEMQGQANPYSKATTVENNATAASTRMEYYLGPFDSFVDLFQERMILKSKFIYDENDVFTYYGGDNQAKFLKIFHPYLQEDLGIHSADNKKEFDRKQRIDQIAERTFGNAQDLDVMMNLINVFNAENSTEAEAIVRRGAKALKESQEANQKAIQDQAAQTEETKRQAIAKQDQQAKDKLENNLEVAEVYAHQQADDTNKKEQNANLRKAAELETKIMTENKKEK